MTKLNQIQQLAAQQAEVSDDMNEVSGNGGKLLPQGAYLGRICEYIDLGTQPQEFNGVAKDPAPQIRLGVALFGPNAQDAAGKPYVLRSYDITISRNEKANAYKAFKALNWKGDKNIKHFAQFVGQPFIFQVSVATNKTTQRQSNKIEWDKTTAAVNPLDNTPYQVPELTDDYYRVLLWDFPVKEEWDALHIEGNRDDGKSKNFIQEKILSALNFQGSPLQLLLAGAGINTLPSAPAQPVAPVAQPQQVAAPLAQPAPVAVPQQLPATPTVAAPSVTPASTQTFPSSVQPVLAPEIPQNISAATPVGIPVGIAVPALPVIPGQV